VPPKRDATGSTPDADTADLYDRSSRDVRDALHAARDHVRGRLDTSLTNADRSS
jgi:hypothetical protein